MILPWKMLFLLRHYKIVTSWQKIYCTYLSKSRNRFPRICWRLVYVGSINKYIKSWSSYTCLISIKFSFFLILDWLYISASVLSLDRSLVLNIFFNVICSDVSKSITLMSKCDGAEKYGSWDFKRNFLQCRIP